MCKYLEKKKKKAFKTTWSDDDSDNSDENISNYVIFQATTKKIIADTIKTAVAIEKVAITKSNDIAVCDELDPEHCEDFDSDMSNEEVLSIEDI